MYMYVSFAGEYNYAFVSVTSSISFARRPVVGVKTHQTQSNVEGLLLPLTYVMLASLLTKSAGPVRQCAEAQA